MSPRYPDEAGFKEGSTSQENAERIEASGRASTLRQRVLFFFQQGGRATADELAGIMREPFLAIRPRLSELRTKGLIEPTGERRRAAGGGVAHVWQIRQ